MDKDLEEQFAQLAKKVEEQFRFTRFTIVLCCLTNIGILIFTVMTTFQSLPMTILGHYMSNLDSIVPEWMGYEDLIRRQRANRAAAAASVTPVPAPTPAPVKTP